MNNREIATVIWFSIFIIYAVYKADDGLKSSAKDVLSAFFKRQIIIPISLLALYALLCIFLLCLIGLWHEHQIKNSIVWFFTFAMGSLFQLSKMEEDKEFFTKAIINLFKLTAIIQFLINVYVFPLYVELIIVPLSVFFVFISEMSKNKPEQDIVFKFANYVLSGLGSLVILFTVYKLISEFGVFAKPKTFYDFVVPPLLTMLMLPSLYLVTAYSSYESMFIRMTCFIKDKELLKYAKIKSVLNFHLDFRIAKLWCQSLIVDKITNKENINRTIARIKEKRRLEKQRPNVSIMVGWSPWRAITFLQKYSLKTREYTESMPDYFSASSSYLDLGEGFMPNNIAYYVDGDMVVAKQLCIKLNVNQPESEDDAKIRFIEIADFLILQALCRQLSVECIEAVLSNQDYCYETNTKKILIRNFERQNGVCDISFIIRNKDYKDF